MTTDELLKQAHVSKQDLANIMRVSRVSVHFWVRGDHEPSRPHAGRYESTLASIKSAVDTGLLPGDLVGNKVPRNQRTNYIRRQLAEVRRKAKTN